MRKIRSLLALLLMLALFLPCALAESPQGIDLALTSTYGDGLSLRLTAGLGETPFCSLTLPTGQIDLAYSQDKGLCVRTGGQWSQVLVEGHPVDAALLTTPLKLLENRSPAEVLGLVAEDVETVQKRLADSLTTASGINQLMTQPGIARFFNDCYIFAQTGVVSLTANELNELASALLEQASSLSVLDELHFSDVYRQYLAPAVQQLLAVPYEKASRYGLFSDFALSGHAGFDSGELHLSNQDRIYDLTYERTSESSWHYVLSYSYVNSSPWDTIEGALLLEEQRSGYHIALNGVSVENQSAFSCFVDFASPTDYHALVRIDNGYLLSIIQRDNKFSFRLDDPYQNVFSLDYTPDRIYAEFTYPPFFYLLPCCETARFVVNITPAADGMDIVMKNLAVTGEYYIDIFTAHIRTALNGLICNGIYGHDEYTLALTRTTNGVTLLFSLPGGDSQLDYAELSDNLYALTFTDAAGQQVSLNCTLGAVESPVIPDFIGAIELTQLLSGIF